MAKDLKKEKREGEGRSTGEASGLLPPCSDPHLRVWFFFSFPIVAQRVFARHRIFFYLLVERQCRHP